MLALGWSTTVLLGVFVVEVIAVVWWSVAKIPFAAKRPNAAVDDDRLFGPFQAKRGEIDLPGPLPPVYPRNLPTLVVVVCFLAPLETMVALAVFGVAAPPATEAAAGQLAVGGLAVVVGRGYETWRDYFHDGGYRDHSARSVLILPLVHLLGVGALLFLAALVDGSGVAGDVVLWAMIVGKLAFDVRSLQVERDPDDHGWLYRVFGSEATEIEPEPVAVPDDDPTVTARPPRLVGVVDAVARGVTYSLSSAALAAWVLAAVLVGVGAASLAVWPLLAAVGVGAFRTLGRYLAYGSVEYRVYDDVLVVYDRLIGEPQARVERTGVTDAAVVRDPLDRLFGTHTLTIAGADDGDERPPRSSLLPADPDAVTDDAANANRSVRVAHVIEPTALAGALGVSWLLER